MKIAIACGGTGGHIFPGLAAAEVLRQRGHDITLWLAGKDVEEPAVRDWKGRVVTVVAEGMPSVFSAQALQAGTRLLRAMMSCRRIMKRDRPAVLLAMGSYASVGPVGAALSLRVPVVLHEANVLPGRAIAFFARWATAVAGSFQETRFYLRRKDLVLTGMPLRRDLERAARAAPARQHDLFTVLVMGGSRGARRLNEVAPAAIVQVHRGGHRLRVVHLAGRDDEAAVRKAYQEAGVPNTVHAFTADMAAVYGAADLAICRSGAATCAELSAFAVPALLVPYPSAMNDHQTLNARALEKTGAADVVPERDLSEAWLADYIAGCVGAPGRLARMSAAARSRAGQSGAEALAGLVERVGGGTYAAG